MFIKLKNGTRIRADAIVAVQPDPAWNSRRINITYVTGAYAPVVSIDCEVGEGRDEVIDSIVAQINFMS